MAALPQVASRGPLAYTAPAAVSAGPPGTFMPGTKVQVGNQRVIIERYLSEGGFAHVYVVRLPRPVDGDELAVLKRVAVPDKLHLANMRTEVETMKRLRGQKHIVKYFDSHASQLSGGGYEVFLLMEYCAGGGLIDFMNTRLQQRLTEPEILKIFTDVAEGVACMHYLTPPLLHRDLKVENVLISKFGSSKIYKVCDFGSTAPARPAATSAAEGRLIEDEIQRHTTLQYRSPEMIDVYRKQPIDEKSDIWALGVFLYKLCYYTTPFEDAGQMAILNASFKYPAYPRFSDQLKMLIASMLREQPVKRPNIYQVLQQSCKMQGREVPVKDIYISRSQSESGKNQQVSDPSSSQPRAGATLAPPRHVPVAGLPDITPMRRGRPEKPVSHHGSARPSPSPLRMMDSSDPFASLDGGKSRGGDELSSKFPKLDEFSLLNDSKRNFDFDPNATSNKSVQDYDFSVRVTQALADDAFVRAPSPPKPKPLTKSSASVAVSQTNMNGKTSREKLERETLTHPRIAPQKPSVMVSAEPTMTSSSPALSGSRLADRPIYRFPLSDKVSRSNSQPNVPDRSRVTTVGNRSGSRLANLLRSDASRSQPALDQEPMSPTSSRPSLEGGRPSAKEIDLGLSRSRSLNVRTRPVSANIGLGPTHVNHKEFRRFDYTAFESAEPEMAPLTGEDSGTNIASDVDFLKAKEEEERSRKHQHKRSSSGSKHIKRASLPSISLAGTKNLLAGRFGDAFRKFENSHQDAMKYRDRSPSPSRDSTNALTPIAGSEATDLSDDRHGLDEIEDLSPEMRRELEKRKLEAEERRVEAATADYRKRMAEKGSVAGRDGSNASSIQSKVQSLLGENERPANRSAGGYGRFTDANFPGQMRQFERAPNINIPSLQHAATDPVGNDSKTTSAPVSNLNVASNDRSQRPIAPPKPTVLRTALGKGEAASQSRNAVALNGAESLSPGDDWETQFSKRYPSLSGLELVETEIDAHKSVPLRTREV